LQIGPPVKADSAGHVTLLVGVRVDINLEDADLWILRVVGEPVRLDENIVRVSSHVSPPSELFGKLDVGSGDRARRRERRYEPPTDRRRRSATLRREVCGEFRLAESTIGFLAPASQRGK